MPLYLNAAAMLAATLAGFVVLARLLQAMRAGRLALPWRGGAGAGSTPVVARLAVEQSCAVDGKRRLMVVRCDAQRVLLMTGGPADLVLCILPDAPAGGAGA